MKRRFREVLIIMTILEAVSSLLGCGCKPGEKGSNGLGKKAVVNESGLTRFSYAYRASRGGDSYEYEVLSDDAGNVTFTFESMRYPEYGRVTVPADKDLLVRLNDLYKEMKIASWEGYDKYNTMMLDGSGFHLALSFADGKKMSAGGENAFPDGYTAFVEKMGSILDPVRDELLEKKRQELIEQGIQGTLTHGLVNIVQYGKSGSDEYSFVFTEKTSDEISFQASVKSKSGEFLPEGTYSIYETISKEKLDLSAVQRLIEQYEVVSWIHWDKYAQNSNDLEHFQFAFSFGEDFRISANGTEFPPHYDEFRHDLLSLLCETVSSVQ